jgi:hypothetical protein
VAQRKTLTEQQISILRWISEGCPDGVMEGDSHRVSAAALRRRGLVRTSGRGPTWSASVTEAGREYLEKVDGEDPPVARQANTSVTQQLVDDVISSDGALRVPRRGWYGEGGVDWEHRAQLAERYGKVPAGKRLDVVVVSDTELEVRLLDDPGNPGRTELVEVTIPGKVGRYHAAARRFRDNKAHHEVSRAQLQRALRIVHAMATEAERRGWTVSSSREGDEDQESARGETLTIVAGGHCFGLSLSEEGVRERGPWEKQVEHYRDIASRWGSYRGRDDPSGPYDADATGELNLHLDVERYWIFRGHQSNWGDRASWKLESRLPHVFREIEERIAKADRVEEEERIEAERRAEEERRAAEERERRWHVLMERARTSLVETRRATVLRSQEQAWREAKRLREYCDAMEAAHGGDPESAEWITWARQFASRLDPLSEPPTMPEPPEETPEALQEHLPEGWSVRGPDYASPPPSTYDRSLAAHYQPDLHRHPFRSPYRHFHR